MKAAWSKHQLLLAKGLLTQAHTGGGRLRIILLCGSVVGLEAAMVMVCMSQGQRSFFSDLAETPAYRYAPADILQAMARPLLSLAFVAGGGAWQPSGPGGVPNCRPNDGPERLAPISALGCNHQSWIGLWRGLGPVSLSIIH